MYVVFPRPPDRDSNNAARVIQDSRDPDDDDEEEEEEEDEEGGGYPKTLSPTYGQQRQTPPTSPPSSAPPRTPRDALSPVDSTGLAQKQASAEASAKAMAARQWASRESPVAVAAAARY